MSKTSSRIERLGRAWDGQGYPYLRMQHGFQRGPCEIGGTMQTRRGEFDGHGYLAGQVSSGGQALVGHPEPG